MANKVDTASKITAANELYELGIPELIAVSALHGRGTADLAQAVAKHLPKAARGAPESDESDESDEIIPRIALIGRPNAGKSSMFNRLAAANAPWSTIARGRRAIQSDARIEADGRTFLIVDTAGIRKRPASSAASS